MMIEPPFPIFCVYSQFIGESNNILQHFRKETQIVGIKTAKDFAYCQL